MSSPEQVQNATDDRLSKLPADLTQQILECLPLQDAVRTSILSTHWRYKWTNIRKIEFNKEFFTSIAGEKMEKWKTSSNYSNILNNILVSHAGIISEFSLFIPKRFRHDEDVDEWLGLVSDKGVTDISIIDDRDSVVYKLPSTLYSAVGLTSLELFNCDLSTLPPTFSGFPCLVSLSLINCKVFQSPELSLEELSENPVFVSCVLEKFIAGCPQLQTLQFRTMGGLKVTIDAPKLVKLCVNGVLHQLCFGNDTKNIRKLQLNVLCTYWGELRDFFSFLPHLESLILGNTFWLHPLHGFVTADGGFIDNLGRLNTLELEGIPLDCEFANYVAFSLLVCPGNCELKRLIVKINKRTVCYCGVPLHKTFCSLLKLTKVKLQSLMNVELKCFSDTRNELTFIEAILECAPALEAMTIEFSSELEGTDEDKLSAVEKVMQYPRASRNAVIRFKP